jgi:hypothetical protein
MPSFSIPMDERRRVYVRLVGAIRHELHKALEEEAARAGLTKAAVAKRLGCDKGFVSKQLNQTGNMRMKTLADFAWALDRVPMVALAQVNALAHNAGSVTLVSAARGTNTGCAELYPDNSEVARAGSAPGPHIVSSLIHGAKMVGAR